MRKISKFIIPLLIISFVFSCFVGCRNSIITVKIDDMFTESIVEIEMGATVDQAIKEAEISLGDNDVVEPSFDTVLSDGDIIIVSRYATVTVSNARESKTVSLAGGTVSQAIEKSGIEFTDKDAVNYDKDAFLSDGMEIVITRLILVELAVDGKTQTITSPACTVSAFLDEQGVKLGEEDIVTPSVDKEMTNDTKLTVKRVETKTVTEKQPVEFNTVYKSSATMNKGDSKVTQEGKNGEKEVKLSIKYIDGKETERKVLEEKVITQPVDRIVIQGTKSSQESTTKKGGKTIVSKQRVDDCDGSGHGYFVITWSDGSVTYEEY